MQAFKEYEGVCKYCGCTEIIMEESQERANAEVCLLGTSKNTRAKETVKSHAVHQVIQEPIMKHSRKPYEAIKRIEALVGGGVRKIELFAREEANDWDCWGNEVLQESQAQ